jgi:hypothetical protein
MVSPLRCNILRRTCPVFPLCKIACILLSLSLKACRISSRCVIGCVLVFFVLLTLALKLRRKFSRYISSPFTTSIPSGTGLLIWGCGDAMDMGPLPIALSITFRSVSKFGREQLPRKPPRPKITMKSTFGVIPEPKFDQNKDVLTVFTWPSTHFIKRPFRRHWQGPPGGAVRRPGGYGRESGPSVLRQGKCRDNAQRPT